LPKISGVKAAVLILIGLSFRAWGQESIAGSVKTVQGGAVIRRGSQTIPAREGMHLLVNDILQTPADGRLGAILQDGTGIGLGPDTELKIDSFVFEPSDGKLGLLLRLARGVMAYFSGRIAKLAPGSVTVETPVGVIGLRGTQMAVTLEGT
jgi:hypothetical protein